MTTTSTSNPVGRAIRTDKTRLVDRLDGAAAKLLFIGGALRSETFPSDRERAGLSLLIEQMVEELNSIAASLGHVQRKEERLSSSDDAKSYPRPRPI